MIKLTTPDYDEFYSFDTEQEAKYFLFGGTEIDDCDNSLSFQEVLAKQSEYILDDSE